MVRLKLSPSSVLITFPNLTIQTEGEHRVVINPVVNTKTTGSPAVLEALRYFETPRSFGESMNDGAVESLVLESLLQKLLVVDVNLLVDPVTVGIGKLVTLAEFLQSAPATDTVAIVGAPVDMATTHDSGARHGPSDVRTACYRFGEEPEEVLDFEFRRTYKRSHAIVDLGNVRVVPGEGINTYGKRLGRIVELALDVGSTPIVIGGDHSITAPLLQSFAKKHSAMGVIHFDAHHDLYLNPVGPFEILTHGTPFRFALREPISYLLQLGLRTLERPPENGNVAMDSRLACFSSRELQYLEPKEVFSKVPRNVPCYVSFDVDCLTPDIAPETGSPVAGGLTYYQALELLDYIATNFDVVGADFVEVSRTRSTSFNSGAQTVGRYIAHLILASGRKKAFTDYLYNY